MIRYDLTCDQGHRFDGWYQSANVFDSLLATGHVVCARCGSWDVTKALMAPAVASRDTPARRITAPRDTNEKALAALRAKVEASADYVGSNFAAEARAIHDGDAPERSIYGEAKFEEAKALIEDGVPVAPLPFLPTRKAH